MSKAFLKVSDFTDAFNGIVYALKDKEVLVGIPEAKGERKSDDPISNAALLYINEFGSELQNIPPRHPMKTGIRLAQVEIAAQFKECAQNVFKSGPSALNTYYERAGFIASNSVKNVINNQIDMEGPSEATLASREARGFKGTKVLVVTGQMRNAITYIVATKGEFKKVG